MSGEPTDEFDSEELALLDEEPDLNQLIEGWLNEARPERYDIRDKYEWMDSVVEKAERALAEDPPEIVIRDQARQRVAACEGRAVKRANAFLRDIAIAGQPPLGWDGASDQWKALCGGLLRLPLSIRKERARIGSVGVGDLEEWVNAEEERKDREWAARELARNGALLLIQWMREQNVKRAEDLRFVEEPGRAA